MSQAPSADNSAVNAVDPKQDYKNHPFITTDYTLNDYILEYTQFTTLEEYYEALRRCIAVLTTGKYVVKEKAEYIEGRPIYVEYSSRALTEKLATFIGSYETTTIKTNSKITQQTSITEIIEVRPMKLIASPQLKKRMLHYHRTALFSSQRGVLSKFIPPYVPEATTPEAMKMIEDYIHDMESRVYNPQSFHEMLASHAYRFRHPSTNIVKIFVLFSVSGGTGKTSLMEHFGYMYGSFALVGAEHLLFKSQFNGWIGEFLYIATEDLPQSDGRNAEFEATLKHIGSSEMSSQKKFQDPTRAKRNVILTMSTNSPTLHNLIDADIALMSRLVVLSMKPPPKEEEREAFKDKYGFSTKTDGLEERRYFFGAALYHYLRYHYEIPQGFNPERYDGEDKEELISYLRSQSNRLPLRFIRKLSIAPSTIDVSLSPYEILQIRHTREPVEEHVFVSDDDLTNSFSVFMSKNVNATASERARYSIKSVTDELTRSLGWKRKGYSSNTVVGYDIVKSKYDEWKHGTKGVNRLVDGVGDELEEEVQLDDDDDIFAGDVDDENIEIKIDADE